MPNSKIYRLVRIPSLMEDEGQFEHIGTFTTKEAAQARLVEYCADGFFKPDVLLIREEETES